MWIGSALTRRRLSTQHPISVGLGESLPYPGNVTNTAPGMFPTWLGQQALPERPDPCAKAVSWRGMPTVYHARVSRSVQSSADTTDKAL